MMAFKFRSKSSLPTIDGTEKQRNSSGESQLSVNPHLSKFNRAYPPWLKEKSAPSQLPAIYQGVLGQVQLQPDINLVNQLGTRSHLTRRTVQADYMNRFTDTERVHQLLSTSHLSNDTLAAIWAHVNQTFPGKLTNRELCLALSLIAIFQRLEEGGPSPNNQPKDPFQIVRSEKKPPVPKLYPGNSSRQTQASQDSDAFKTSPLSTPYKMNTSLSMGALLVNLDDDVQYKAEDTSTNIFKSTTNLTCNSRLGLTLHGRESCLQETNDQTMRYLNLIDMITDDGFELQFIRLAQVWSQSLIAMKSLFKRTFDILNVEYSRRGSIEALRSAHGALFSKQLCSCYPIAHNIKSNIDRISSLKISEHSCSQIGAQGDEILRRVFERRYLDHMSDLMNAINEYWAVLINLFNESGHTKFIELIMDGLNNSKKLLTSNLAIEDLATELDGLDKSSLCSICFHGSYLTVNKELVLQELELDVSNLIESQHELLTDDKRFYYHPKCANFWLNHVDDQLPFCRKLDENILSPAIN